MKLTEIIFEIWRVTVLKAVLTTAKLWDGFLEKKKKQKH